MATVKSAALVLALCACGGDSPVVDATPHDAPVDVDNGTCGALMRFRGELLDWDSGSTFCGVRGALLQVQGSSEKLTTPPNGRIELCVPNQAVVQLDIAHSIEDSECSRPIAKYTLPGLAVVNRAVIDAGGIWGGRAFVDGRVTVDAAKAQVFVHVSGTPREVSIEVSIEAAHGPAQALVNNSWVAGATTGTDVFFPDVVPTSGSTTLTAGGAIGSGMIPLVAGKVTYVTVVAN